MSYRDETLAGQELTEKEAEALAMHDSGASDQEIADKMGYASANGAGNVRRVAMTKVGLGSEVRQGGGGGSSRTSTPRKVSASQMIEDSIERTKAEIDRLGTRLHEAREQADIKPADLVKAESQRLTELVQQAQAKLDEFNGLDKPARDEWVSTKRDQASNRLAQMEQATTEAIEANQAELTKMEAALEAIRSLES